MPVKRRVVLCPDIVHPSVCPSVCPLTFWEVGVQLILDYSWARSAILVAGKGRGGMFLFRLFLHFHIYSSSLSSLLFSPFLWEMTQNDPEGLTC